MTPPRRIPSPKFPRGVRAAAVTACCLWLLGAVAMAGSTRTFVIDDADSFGEGELHGAAVHSDGSVTPGVATEAVVLEKEAVAWSFVRGTGREVFVGTGNDARILRVLGDKSSVYFDSDAVLVSAMVRRDEGSFFAATLPDGKIHLVTGDKQSRVFATLEENTMVWALVWDQARQRLLAATGPKGQVWAIDAGGQASLLHEVKGASHIVSMVQGPDGAIYAGTDGQARLLRLHDKRVEVVYQFSGNELTSIAVHGGTIAVAANDFPEPKTSGSPQKPTAAKKRTGKGAVYRVLSSGLTEEIYSDSKEYFTKVDVADDGTIYAGTGKEGRVIRIAPDRSHSIWIDVDEREVLALDLEGSDPFVLTGDGAALHWVVDRPKDGAHWTSAPLDGEGLTRFGQITWRALGAVSVTTRSGNTSPPDDSWSAWSATLAAPGPIRSAPARYLQVRVHLPGTKARLLGLTAYYLRQNERAIVTKLGLQKKKGDGDSGKATTTYKLEWSAENPDSDTLRYELFYRHERQGTLRPILAEREVLTKTAYDWETEALPDGHYVVRVVATDDPSNPPDLALSDTFDSEPIRIDNHAPRIHDLRYVDGKILATAADSLGPIASAEYAIDGGAWTTLFPKDDLFDTAEEKFEVTPDLSGGEHVVALRARDAGGNATTAELIVQVTR
ncbi:MAG: WD40 repeat domain-containing protein [Myxococcales bacterium]|nr:WD40 repeat domain-containing protein [Myxococcales bacterium]